MGNCSNPCMTDNENKKKITVEQNIPDNIAYIKQSNQEFEIEYGNDRAQMGGAYFSAQKQVVIP